MNKPKIIAHRGANRYAPQNTIPAFEKAVELGADGTETDVHITKDGHIVICHNDTVDEMSNGTGAIGDYMFDDIRKLDFGSKFSKDFAGVTLPTVEEYLECMKKSDKLSVMNIEIKPNKSEREDIVRKTIEAVKDYGLFDELLISSFDYKMLVEAKKYDPKCKTAYLYPIYGQVVRRWFFQPLHLAQKILGTTFQTFYNNENGPIVAIKVNAWTVDDERDVIQMLENGVDGIITDRPDYVEGIVDRYLAEHK